MRRGQRGDDWGTQRLYLLIVQRYSGRHEVAQQRRRQPKWNQ